MGTSNSTNHSPDEQRNIETLANSMGSLPLLQKSFNTLSNPVSKTIPVKSLQECFCYAVKNSKCEVPVMSNKFPDVFVQLGPSIVDLFFGTEKGGVTWIEFVRGYAKCCGKMSTSMMLSNLLKVFATATEKAGIPSKLQFEVDEYDYKISGSLLPDELLVFLSMCWIMLGVSRSWAFSPRRKNTCLPSMHHLVFSAILSCNEVARDLNVWDCNISGVEGEIPAGKIQPWILKTVPHLGNCLTDFVHKRLQDLTTGISEPSSLSLGDISSRKSCDSHLLTHGIAWAVFLTLRTTVNEELLKACFPSADDGINETPLYRSSLHGKGLNRFWSKVEGYQGPLLILISGTLENSSDGKGRNVRKWIIGILVQQSFENRDAFYGSSGSLYAISPVFHEFSHSGKGKNFVYSHLHPTGTMYEPNPKPVGIAFGGSIGSERIFLDEDFLRATIRHHAVDRTYAPGSLIPSQGFLPIESLVSEVEVWGLGGKTAEELQRSYKNREQLFTDQRRKVNLKTFGSWDDSPEKIMMDMVSDPNGVRREDR